MSPDTEPKINLLGAAELAKSLRDHSSSLLLYADCFRERDRAIYRSICDCIHLYATHLGEIIKVYSK